MTPLDWNEEAAVSMDIDSIQDCPNRTSVMGLAVACALLVVLYLCTVFCLCIRPANAKSLGATHIPGRSSSNNGLGLVMPPRDYVR